MKYMYHNTAIIIIDMIYDLLDPSSPLSSRGYSKYLQEYMIISRLNTFLGSFHKSGGEVIFVNLAFQSDYHDLPIRSPLFGRAQEFGVFRSGTHGVEILDQIQKNGNEKIFIKNRVSIFYKTGLEEYLRGRGITDLIIAGGATNFAIESAVREAHDRDFLVSLLADACFASDRETHLRSVENLGKLATIL